MELGQKIKQARLDAGLSQRQLCGDAITRNMLSLIESGRAKPSMDTLGYLAARLGKSLGYFLDDQAVTSPNQAALAQARQRYAAGEYRQVLDALGDWEAPDDCFDPEKWLLEALACLALAEQALDQGKNAYARTLLEQAVQAGQHTPYYTRELERQRLLLAYRQDPFRAAELAAQLPELTRELLLRGAAALRSGDAQRCVELLEAAGERDADWCLLRGEAAMALRDWSGAAQVLSRAESRHPKRCVPLLERCYRELEDYKRAYEYARKQIDQ